MKWSWEGRGEDREGEEGACVVGGCDVMWEERTWEQGCTVHHLIMLCNIVSIIGCCLATKSLKGMKWKRWR